MEARMPRSKKNKTDSPPAQAPSRTRQAWLLPVLLILAGVFFPTFVAQIIDVKMFCAVLIVLVAWMVHYMGWVRPHDPVVAAKHKERQEAELARIQAKAAKRGTVAEARPAPPKYAESPDGKDKEEGGQSND